MALRKSALALMTLCVAGAAWGFWLAPRLSAAPDQGPARRPTGVPVTATPATRRDVPVYLWSLGNAQAYNSVTIRAQVDGQLTEVAFVEGQSVRAGDVLARIDPRIYQADLDQAIARQAQDQALLDKARRDLDRNVKLVEKSYVSRQQYDATQAQVAQFEAAVKGDAAAVERARVPLDRATIRSPIDGRAGVRLVDKGNIVRANDGVGIVTITQTRPISLMFTLPEETLQDILRAMASGPLPVAAESRDGQRQFDVGVLKLIDNAVDQTTGTVRLKAEFPNEAGLLWPGQFIKARLHVKTLRHVIAIPVSAIQSGPDGSFVYLVAADGRALVRPVKLGQTTDQVAVVEDGLRDGDIVVTGGQYRLQPGSLVEVASNAVAAVGESAPK